MDNKSKSKSTDSVPAKKTDYRDAKEAPSGVTVGKKRPKKKKKDRRVKVERTVTELDVNGNPIVDEA
jgi:hypothetical protein